MDFPTSFDGLDHDTGKRWLARVNRELHFLHSHGYGAKIAETLDDLESFAREHPEYRSPNAAFDRRFHPDETRARGVFLMRDGRRVGTLWYRIVPLHDRWHMRKLTLQEAFEQLHIFYDDPLDAPRRETCEFKKTLPKSIFGGSICYSGWAYNAKEHRHPGLFRSIADLLRALAIVSADPWEWYISLVRECKEEAGEVPRGIKKAIESFGHDTFTRHLIHNGEKYWLLALSYEEAVEKALKVADG